MTDETDCNGVHFVAFSDGSCRPTNPGQAGFGIYGYTYKETLKPKNIKHPVHGNLYFTRNGISNIKDEKPLEVLNIVEVIKAINNPTSTNNEAELLAFATALEKASEIVDLKSLTIYTDSNYIVSAFNDSIDRWNVTGWKRLDGKPIVHVAVWKRIYEYKKLFKLNNLIVDVIWVKGHADSFCNNLADLYSVVGSNSARRQLLGNYNSFNETILDSNVSYADYKKSYLSKDIILYFRDLYFSSNKIDDTNYCFLSTSENPNMIGKRDTATIFANNIGYVPDVVNNFKKLFREIERNYVCTCCIKISKLDNKDLHRLTSLVNVEDLVTKNKINGKVSYNLIGDTSPFIFENGMDYPFVVSASGLFTRMLDVSNEKHIDSPNRIIINITDTIVQNGKIAFSNKEKYIDFSECIKDRIKLTQKLLVTIGHDIPSYLALKNIEEEIVNVNLIIDCKTDSNFCTVYTNIETKDRNIYSVNIENKFLRSL